MKGLTLTLQNGMRCDAPMGVWVLAILQSLSESQFLEVVQHTREILSQPRLAIPKEGVVITPPQGEPWEVSPGEGQRIHVPPGLLVENL